MYHRIIVGAGSAGSVLANRLSADPACRVLLLEAGPPDRNPLIHMPLGLAILARMRSINWSYQTHREPALAGRSLYWPRGRTLGGSSSINAMIYMRGHPEDYRIWAEAAGSDWDWDHVLPLFRALEANQHRRDEWHGNDGALTVSNLRKVNPLSEAFVAAGVAAGFPQNDDFNGATQEGVGLYQVTQRNGQRCSAAVAFLDPVRHRPNLDILTGALVERVLFAGHRACGVVVDGRQIELAEGGEVILAGGAINSPQILMLSGIGPADHLASLGIPVLADRREVGRNLADHLDLSILAETHGRDAIAVAPSFLPRAVKALSDYLSRREGELTSNVAEAGGFVRSDPGRDRPNIQFHFLPAKLLDHGRQTAFGYGLTLHVCDLLPKSRGQITLASPDPQAHPKIEAGYLSHPDDIETLLAGVKLGRQILAAPPMKALIHKELQPGPACLDDAALVADIRQRAETIYHPAGSCRMGRDADAVVDPAGRVRGVESLRVVDASIMPSLVAGNTNAPTMMLAENIAQMMT